MALDKRARFNRLKNGEACFEKALDEYIGSNLDITERGLEDVDTGTIIDMLVGGFHWCNAKEIDIELAIRTARHEFLKEKQEFDL